MITLTTERGIERISSWDDVVSVPGFTPEIDPSTVKLKSVIGGYDFDALIPCGLSTCHQPHGKGFLIVTSDGRVTNIGRICGKRHFSVEFTQQTRIFAQDLQAQRSREALWAIKQRLPSITSELRSLKAGDTGAGWINARINQLKGVTDHLPMPVVNAVRQAIRRNNGSLTIEQRLTDEERERGRGSDVAGLEHRRAGSAFMEVQVGQLEGFAALAPGNSLRELLNDVEQFLSTLADTDIDALANRQLRDLSKQASTLDASLEQIRTVVEAGRRLLVRQNIRQLAQFATSRPDSRILDQFIRSLPE